MSWNRFSLLVLVLWMAVAGPGEADVVFPARLNLDELEPGIYAVTFTLPLVEGRVLRAAPMLPPVCREVTERNTDPSATGITRTWRVACEPHSLAGEAILIEGLLGTQTDLLLEVSTLDGRLHSTVLKPSRPGLIIPSPPSLGSLAGESLITGMRRVVRCAELWLLILVLTCLGFNRKSSAAGILVFAGAHGFGQWAAKENGLVLSAHLPPLFALLSALVPALDLSRGAGKVRGWSRPLWVSALLLGMIYGGGRPETIPIEGLSDSEQVAGSSLFSLGIGMGLALITATLVQFRHVWQLIPGGRSVERLNRSFGYIAGVICVGLLVHRGTALFLVTTGVQRAPFEVALLAAVLGAVIGADGFARRGLLLLPFTALLGAGLALGLGGIAAPFGTLTVYGSLFFFGILLLLQRFVPSKLAFLLGGTAVIGHGWHTGQIMLENVSFPLGSAAGAGTVAVCVFYASLCWSDPSSTSGRGGTVRALGALAAGLALAWRLGEYYRWIDGPVATEAALGYLRLPLLAFLLLVAGIVLWPRQRKVLRELGMKTRASARHWVLIGLAFFLLPVGTVGAHNPFFEPDAPRGDDARRVVAQVLWNTYHAFNLTDEDELYDRIAQNVTGDLVADLYLDSRRRLTSGTREGAEVTVRDVSVVEVEGSGGGGGTNAKAGFSYTCRWIVTARVRHLQHIHHRQNIYNGALTIRIDGDRWKIARVELTSEDRVVLPWQPT